MTRKTGQNYIDHVVLMLDASSSMTDLAGKTIELADELVKFLAEKSKKSGEETRVSVYSFADTAVCHIWDMDVFRLPSMKEHYKVYGWTALIDAVTLALDDADLIPEKYGSHDFTFYALTDGDENHSMGSDPRAGFGRVPKLVLARQLTERLGRLKDNRSVAILVPDEKGVEDAVSFGFPEGNIRLWDATSEKGLEEAVEGIKTAITNYTDTRTRTGVRGSKTLFVGGSVDATAVKAKLIPLAHTAYELVPVTKTAAAFEKFGRPTKADLAAGRTQGKSLGWFVRIDDFLNKVKPPFEIGKGYYQLFSADARRSEKVQGNKAVAVMDKKTSQIYVGPEARKIVGLPDCDQTVKPGSNKDYDIFIKSSSDNRQLVVGTKLLILT